MAPRTLLCVKCGLARRTKLRWKPGGWKKEEKDGQMDRCPDNEKKNERTALSKYRGHLEGLKGIHCNGMVGFDSTTRY